MDQHQHNDAAQAAQAPRCVVCRRHLWDDEIDPHRRPACRLCEKQGSSILRELPSLYRLLGHCLERGASGEPSGRVSGSRSAPLPGNETALALRGPGSGGIAYGLVFWEQAIREELSFTPAPFRGNYEQTVDGAAHFLQQNAPWIWGAFLGVDELHADLRRWQGAAKALIHQQKPERTVPVECPCGQVLRISMSTDGRRCTCGTQYGWAELRQLPLAQRAAA